MKFKDSFGVLNTTVNFLMLGSMVFTTVLLINEYYFFKEQAQKMMQLQKDYQEYIQVFKQALYTGQKKKEMDSLDTTDEEYIQNEIISDAIQNYCLNTVNREVVYLRDNAIDFGKAHNLEKVVKPLYEGGTWDTNYSQAIFQRLSQKSSTQQSNKKIKNQRTKITYYPVEYSLSWPLNKSQFWISSKFGPRKQGFHYGLDMAALKGTQVYAAKEGVVIEASYTPNGYGKSIVIHHGKCKTRYAHLNDMYVKVGQRVEKTKPIGCVGDTGLVRGKNDASHLHFEVIDLFGKRINPLYILK